MSRFLTVFAVIISAVFQAEASLQFSGTSHTPVVVETTAATGLENIYMLYSTAGVTLTYTASSASTAVDCRTFGMQGAAYSDEVDPATISRDGRLVSISNLKPDTGYSFTENGRTVYYWIADYSAHPYTITAINIDDTDNGRIRDCSRMFLTASGSAPRITYYSINGRSYEVDRQITLTYTTLTPDTENFRFISAQRNVNFAHIDGVFSAEAPLCDTYLTLSGDRFLRAWGEESSVTSSMVQAIGVDAITTATQSKTPSDNELKTEQVLGGSAPVDITFNAAVTDAAIFTQWQMARDEEFEDVIYRTSDLDFSYTFTDMGTTYVRFMAANAAGDCDLYSETYQVYIGESRLLCPNAFSPGASEGVNDEWKVSYKSIIRFDCYIFNRWGEKMTEFHDPSQGWDGKYGGKLVPPGVYYYVIKALGSDGKEYNLSGDINIIRYQ